MTVVSRTCARCSRPLSRYNNGDYCGSCESSDDRAENDRISSDAASEIGQRLKAVRQRRGMSLRVVAGLAGVSAAYLSMVETGKRSLDRYSLIRDLAEALRVPASDLAPSLSEGGVKPNLPRPATTESGIRPALVHEDKPAIDDSDLLAMQRIPRRRSPDWRRPSLRHCASLPPDISSTAALWRSGSEQRPPHLHGGQRAYRHGWLDGAQRRPGRQRQPALPAFARASSGWR